MVKGPMTKNILMQYTLIALFFLAFLSYFLFGIEALVVCLVSFGVAVGCDILLSMVMGSKGPKNTMSAAVFGLIVALSYSLGLPHNGYMNQFQPWLVDLNNTCILL